MADDVPAPRRIHVMGTSCSGKSTLARQLARRLGAPHVELDRLFWRPGWVRVPPPEFADRVLEATSGARWIVDGNALSHDRIREHLWSSADVVAWLDYPLPLVLARYVRRTTGRIVSGREPFPGCRERLGWRLLRRDELLRWILSSHGEHRRTLPAALAARHGPSVRLRSPRETISWLDSVPSLQ